MRPLPPTRRRARASVTATLITAALILVGALTTAPAIAEPTGGISGHVLLPDDFEGAVTDLSVQARTADDEHLFGVSPAADGSFTIARAEAGETYLIWVGGLPELLRGYVGAGGEVVEHLADATPVTAPATGIDIHVRVGGTITGQVEMPPGAYVRGARLTARAADGRIVSQVDATEDGFTLVGLWPGQTYLVHLRDTMRYVTDGYYADDGRLVPRAADATVVTPGASGLVLRPVLAPYLAGRAALPADIEWDAEFIDPSIELVRIDRDEPMQRSPVYSGVLGRFRFGQVDPAGTYVLHMSYGRASSNTQPLVDGYWAGNNSPLVQDVDDALTLRPSRGGVLVPLLTVNKRAPQTWGTPRPGATLHATRGAWRPAASTVTFQWLRDGRAIAGATWSYYRVRAADQGHNLSVRVTATSPDHTRLAVRSALVRVTG